MKLIVILIAFVGTALANLAQGSAETPQNITLIYSTAKLKWTPRPTNELVNSYSVYRINPDGSTNKVTQTSGTQQNLSTVVPAVTGIYGLFVRSVNQFGEGELSDVYWVIYAPVPPGKVEGVVVE